MENWIRVSKIQELYRSGRFPLAQGTLYKLHHMRTRPELFSKIGGALFVDQAAVSRLLEEGRGREGGEYELEK